MIGRVTTFEIDKGILVGARQCPSPNQSERPPGAAVELLVVHNISLPPARYGGAEIEQFFCNVLDWEADPYFEKIRGMTVSAHLLVRRDGELVQFVNFDRRAWHAGVSCFHGRDNCNDFSIGIELEGCDDDHYSEQQYSVLARVVAALKETYPVPGNDHLVGHSDIAPGRKTDPGPCFDWQRLYTLLAELGSPA